MWFSRCAPTAFSMRGITFRRVFSNVESLIFKIILYWSGEPLIAKDLTKMIRYASDRGVTTHVSTNAVLLDEKMCNDLIDAGLDHVIVCIDGFSTDTFEDFRSGARFDTVLRNLEILDRVKNERRSNYPFLEVQWINTATNAHELAAAREYFSKLNRFDHFHVKSVALPDHRFLSDTQMERLINKYIPNNGKVRRQYLDPETIRRKPSNLRCKVTKTPAVTAQGEITMCCYDFKGEYSVGDVKEDRLEVLWQSDLYKERRAHVYALDYDLCQNCPSLMGND
jgi:radical SAM protein with 4Fe4S-binding SPASM domain